MSSICDNVFFPVVYKQQQKLLPYNNFVSKNYVFVFCIMVVIFWHLEPKGSNSKERRAIKGLGNDTEYGLSKFIGLISPENDAKLIYFH